MRHDIDTIRNISTAVLWKIDDDVAAGVPFPEAKDKAIKHASKSWSYLIPETREAIFQLCYSIGPADLSKRTIAILKEDFRKDIEKYRGYPMGRIERAFYWLTGMSF